ncbi:DUF3995 domain-containing protein [Streptomyces lasalocidi]|uniref:DUF3995 domain-containing protein n=2 Tax=Streptomyces lasalocidi TaxID=324833 RepID=A0A4U5W4D9_STRLS|nr:DUF3995 domain-containing protein [Streptomyces lasalocidi]
MCRTVLYGDPYSTVRMCLGRGGGMNLVAWVLGPAGDDGTRQPGSGSTAGADLGVRAAAIAASAGLSAAGALHAVWAFSPWPLDSRADYAAVVVGVAESQLPSRPLTLTVAGMLGLACWLVVTGVRPTNHLAASRLVRGGLWTLCGVLLIRGLGGLIVSGFTLSEAPAEFRHWDLLLYSPLCIVLGGLTGFVTVRVRSRRSNSGSRA